MTTNGRTYTIVGVMPARFMGPQLFDSEVWLPIGQQPHILDSYRSMNVYGRLRPGVSETEALAELEVVAARRGLAAEIQPLTDMMLAGDRRIALLFFGFTAVVLLIVCANVANLLLARFASGSREMMVRSAIGAGRLRLISQSLAEMLLVALGVQRWAPGSPFGYSAPVSRSGSLFGSRLRSTGAWRLRAGRYARHHADLHAAARVPGDPSQSQALRHA